MTTQIKISLFVISALAIVFLMVQKPRQQTKQNKTKVVASFYPLYFFAREIGKEHIQISNITPAGSEPHDYEPITDDIRQIEESNLLIINGAGFEPWINKLQNDLVNTHIKVISAAENITALDLEEKGQKMTDPHIWLDPVLAKQVVKTITDALIAIDSAHTSSYNTNSLILQEKLTNLDRAFTQGVKNCKQKHIVTSHAAFGYLAARYELEQVSIQGIVPDEDPSPQNLAEISKFAKTNSIQYIFFETLVSPRLADTIAKETGAKTLMLNPLEGLTDEEQRDGVNYFSIQRENLANLRIALECQ